MTSRTKRARPRNMEAANEPLENLRTVRLQSPPAKSGGQRLLGVPIVADRVAQMVVKRMIEAAELKARPDIIKSYLTLFQEGVLLAAWDIWMECREGDIPVPDAVLNYIDQVAANILALTKKPPKRIDPAFRKVLGGKSGRGRGSEFSRYRETTRDMDLALEVSFQRAGTGGRAKSTLAEAIQKVADDPQLGWNSSTDTVRRAFGKHRRPARPTTK